MSHADRPVGNLQRTPASTLAARCADRIGEYAGPRAVTVDPEGYVWVESPEHMAPSDWIGTWQRDLGVLALTRDIRDELLAEKERRGFLPHKRRIVMGAQTGRHGTARRPSCT